MQGLGSSSNKHAGWATSKRCYLSRLICHIIQNWCSFFNLDTLSCHHKCTKSGKYTCNFSLYVNRKNAYGNSWILVCLGIVFWLLESLFPSSGIVAMGREKIPYIIQASKEDLGLYNVLWLVCKAERKILFRFFLDFTAIIHTYNLNCGPALHYFI